MAITGWISLGALVVALSMAYFRWLEHRADLRARGRGRVRRLREEIDSWKGDIERLGDACPPELRYDYDLARRHLAARYAVFTHPEENDRQITLMLWMIVPIGFGLLLSYTGQAPIHSLVALCCVAALFYMWLMMRNFDRRLDRSRMLYALLGPRRDLPALPPVSLNVFTYRVPRPVLITRWITDATGGDPDPDYISKEQLGVIQQSIDDWYANRALPRVKRWFSKKPQAHAQTSGPDSSGVEPIAAAQPMSP